MVPTYSVGLLLLAVLSGLAFAGVGVSYRAGQARGMAVTSVALAICLVGAPFFAVKGRAVPLPSVPLAVWAMACLAGTGQFIALTLMGPALARGPLSPVWCAVNLNFVLTIAYARLFLGEQIAMTSYAGIGVAVACVLAAALGQQTEHTGEEGRRPTAHARLVYGGLLLTILLTNSLWITGLKHFSARTLPDGRSYLDVFGDHYALGVYLVLGGLVLAEAALARRPFGRLRPWLTAGGLGAVGSVVGFWALAGCASLPASVVLTINSVASLLGAAVVSVLAFHERRTPFWYATIGLAVLAVVLVNSQ